MLRRDGGVELLNKLKEAPDCPDNIKRLSTITIMKAYDPNIGPDIEETWPEYRPWHWGDVTSRWRVTNNGDRFNASQEG